MSLAPGLLRGKRALVVDDMATIRHILMTMLKNEGCECAGASNGAVALELLARKSFHLVLCDWNMPGMNGSELVAKIRQAYPSLPIIMVTAEGEKARIQEMMALGIKGYIVKPFKQAALLASLAKIFPA